MLPALPPNAAHMNQPLDVAVFKPFKAMNAIQIACSAYETAIMDRPNNAVSGFRSTGLFPPSLVNMTKRLRVNTNGGARGEIGKEAWLMRQRETVKESWCQTMRSTY
ncbi:hypothetical protein PHYSODRAFT_525774 [Phytophthora sojae]|uniref:DDE-1 domain-containing protein n=1 Tax=Phytophthora sojae (strain P6497) TaxID=1094619 RepID=G5A7D1_PHYSP|nr:hypothetical protein PHYSODRAFT_525774 [Phytophthora sojae]EGZ09236.1 hypothetical protein PHYSODRAFT_525774 [Phytophthora sojae]|eukprot:XP_009535869.1 hypothetical protein PHYSODRAFT_525774 [Phytophthora sojae]